jgi:carbonic anhydrase
VAGTPLERNVPETVRATAQRQRPSTAVLSCIDSRVPVETVFDLTIGQAFSVRNAGNVLSDGVLGSLEFACALSGARLIVVMGHTGCGAVKGACDHLELGHLTGLLRKIEPVVDATAEDGDRSSANAAFVDAVAEANVRHVARDLLVMSDVLRARVEVGTLGVVAAMYDVRTGRVAFLESA